MQTGDFEVQGQKLNATIRYMHPNLESTEISMNGTTVMKQVFNGTTGFQSQMGQKKDITGEELAEKKAKKGLFEQLYYNGKKLEVAGVAKVGAADAYKIIVTQDDEKKGTEYYDVKSGLLLKEEKTAKVNGTDITQIAEYSDYRKTGNVMIPYKINQSVVTPMGNQDFAITIKDVKVNAEVKAADFN